MRSSFARRLRIEDPGRVYLKSALRAGIVMPAVFAFADNVIAQPQTTIFATFGSFAMLVLAQFGGPPRNRLRAYVTLALTGIVLIVVGTACSRDTALATVVVALIGFAVLMSGVINTYLAAGAFPTLLSLIISANVPAPNSAILDRVEGWALASAVGISAVMLLWPPRPRDELRSAAARACDALAELVESQLHEDRARIADLARDARAAVAELRRRFVATPTRPTGLTGSSEALAFLVDELDWLQSLVVPAASQPGAEEALCREENREAMEAAAAALRASASTLEGGEERPDFDRLERATEAVIEALVREVRELPAEWDDTAVVSAFEPTLRIRGVAYAASDVGRNALVAAGHAAPDMERGGPPTRSRAVAEVLGEHVRWRSVSFRNSVRGAAGLAIATYVAQKTSVQHAFWVVLGTLSVLRSNALGTGSTIISALAGTAIGISVGVGIILAIGTHEGVLWVVLPFAVLLASYAPAAISFAAGQAGFTVVLVIVFNIIQPTGWKVGLVRIEDVAIGFAISIGVGLLFWPRGAGAVLREALAAAFARGADYVAAVVRVLARGSSEDAVRPVREAARAAGRRLDDAFRQFMAERRVRPLDLEAAGSLVAGATRVRLAGYSLLRIGHAMNEGVSNPERCAGALDRDVDAFRSWYVALGDALVRSAPAPEPQSGDTDGAALAVRCLREAVAEGHEPRVRAALGLVLASEHLRNLQRLEEDLVQAVNRVAEQPRAEPGASRGRSEALGRVA